MMLMVHTYTFTHRVVCRGRIVVFPHPLEYNLQSTQSINEIFSLAPAAGPAVVHDMASMEPTSLEDVQDHVKEKLPNFDSSH